MQGFALVRRKDERRDKTGKAYLDLELADATGAIPAKIWSDLAALASAFAAGDFVKFRGQVQAYRDQLQLKIDNCRPAGESDRTDGFDEALLIPSTREDIDALDARLRELLAKDLSSPGARQLAEAGARAPRRRSARPPRGQGDPPRLPWRAARARRSR